MSILPGQEAVTVRRSVRSIYETGVHLNLIVDDTDFTSEMRHPDILAGPYFDADFTTKNPLHVGVLCVCTNQIIAHASTTRTWTLPTAASLLESHRKWFGEQDGRSVVKVGYSWKVKILHTGSDIQIASNSGLHFRPSSAVSLTAGHSTELVFLVLNDTAGSESILVIFNR